MLAAAPAIMRFFRSCETPSQVGRASGAERHYAHPMAQSRVPDRLQPLSSSSGSSRRRTARWSVQAVNEAAPRHLPTVPWSEVERMIGVVNIGGNAVEDCEAIYDDVDVVLDANVIVGMLD